MIELSQQKNPLVDAWNIWYQQRLVGYIIKISINSWAVVRRKKDHLEIATRVTTFSEAKQFVMEGVKNAQEVHVPLL